LEIFVFFSLWKRGSDRSWGLAFDLESVLENVYSEEGAVFEPATPSLVCLAQ
jgi:hypothetical protein